jgi:hypothetical protein
VSNSRGDFADTGNVYVTVFDWFSNVGAGGDNDNTVFVALLLAP